MVHFARTRLTARKYQEKYYGTNAIAVPDDKRLNALSDTEEQYDKTAANHYKSLYEAKETNKKSEIHRIKGEVHVLKAEVQAPNKTIPHAQNHTPQQHTSNKQ